MGKEYPHDADKMLDTEAVASPESSLPKSHSSDCAMHNAPAYPARPCDCQDA